MKNNVKIQDNTQSLQSCVSVSVTELRIGNLVKLDDKDYHALEDCSPLSDKNNIWRVERIDKDGDISIYNEIENLFEFVNIEDLESITLIEKWVSIFGFESYIGWDEMEFWCLPKDKDNSDRFELLALLQGYELPSGKICKFVHQLQNCYFFYELNGSELQDVVLTEH